MRESWLPIAKYMLSFALISRHFALLWNSPVIVVYSPVAVLPPQSEL